MGMLERLRMISLGQGQGPIAESLIAAGREGGDWVYLQNCHLATSWMPAMEMILETHQTMKLNEDFRLWLSSMPSKIFPSSILQTGIKLTNEPPKGLRANLKRTYEDLTEEEIMYFDAGGGCGGGGAGGGEPFRGDAHKARAWKKLLFGLTFFHACIQERRKYGAIGWNIRYEWNQSDLLTAMANLRMYIEDQKEVPYETLRYIMGDVNYGGRVTDYMDQRTVAAVLGTYICPEVVQDHDYRYTVDGQYYAPPNQDMAGIRQYIDQLPLSDKPEVFGLHRNAAVAFDNSETKYLMDTIISIQPRTGAAGGGKSPDELAAEIASDLASKTPGILTDEHSAPVTFQADDAGAMNSLGTFLQIEMLKFNKLLEKIASSLTELQRAIKGTVVMSKDLDRMFQALLLQRVPDMWAGVSYLSLKPLGSWFKELVARVEFMDSWIKNGPPDAFWMSAFFFPQGYMTAALQMYARSTRIAIDTLDFATKVLTMTPEDVVQPAEQGVYFYGAFIEGCRWDAKASKLAESTVGETHVYMPVIWLDPVTKDKMQSLEGKYMCPFYKVSSRAGTLSTTGHSTNYIRSLELPTGDFSPEHWVRRSVALLASLDT
jgi:dynein heavy chain